MKRGLAFILACAVAACGKPAPQQPKLKCRAGSTDKSVMLAEWSNLERANLERLLAGGAIAVEYHGCEMAVVPCQLAGQYGWQRAASSSQEDLQLTNDLTLTAAVAGHARLTGMEAVQVPAFCQNATHLVDAISVGAFTLSRGSKPDAPREIVRSVGELAACSGASDDGPAAGCNATIEVSLVEIPGRLGNRPVGAVRAEIVSGVSNMRWDVYVDDKAVCTTPCSRWIEPQRTVTLRMRDADPKQEVILRGLPADKGPLSITAKPIDTSKQDQGSTLALVGGGVVFVGSLLGIAAAARQEGGWALGSLAMLAIGTPILILGISWSRTKPESLVVPLYDRGNVRAVVSPFGISGSF